MPVTVFDGREVAHAETAYHAWTAAHPDGFVLNSWKPPAPGYLALHRSGCPSITQYRPGESPGAFTEGSYTKICADTRAELQEWAQQLGSPNGAFTHTGCNRC